MCQGLKKIFQHFPDVKQTFYKDTIEWGTDHLQLSTFNSWEWKIQTAVKLRKHTNNV